MRIIALLHWDGVQFIEHTASIIIAELGLCVYREDRLVQSFLIALQ